ETCGSLIRSMVWLNTKPAVAASRIGATPGTAASSSRVWAVMSKARGWERSVLSPPGDHAGVAAAHWLHAGGSGHGRDASLPGSHWIQAGGSGHGRDASLPGGHGQSRPWPLPRGRRALTRYRK